MYRNRKETRDFNTFLRELKSGEMKPVVLCTGVEEFQIRWAVGMIRKTFVAAGMEAMDYACFTESDAEAEAVLRSLNTFTMLSKKRVVWIRDIPPLTKKGAVRGWPLSDIRRLADYAANPNENTVAVFSCEEAEPGSELVKALKKHGSVYTFGKLTRSQLASFADKRFRAAGKTVSTADMSYLMDVTGYFNKEGDYRLFSFEGDLKKMIAHADGDRITREDIDAAVDGEGERFIFDLLDGISGNDKTRAFSLIHNRLAAGVSDEMDLVLSIASQIELLLEVREFQTKPARPMTPQEMNAYTKIHEFRLKKAARYASRYSVPELRAMLRGIYRVNERIVTGEMTPRLALELFVAGIGGGAESRY